MISFRKLIETHAYVRCSDQTWGQFNSGIGIDYLKKLELINLKLELKFATKKYIHKLIYHLII